MRLLRGLRAAFDSRLALTPVPSSGSLVDALPDGVVVLDARGRITHVNAKAAELLARPAAALFGRELASLVIRAHRDTVERHERLARGGEPQQYDVTASVRGPSGTERRVFAVRSAPVRDDGELPSAGERVGTIVTLRDVTDSRTAAEELARSESRYRHLFEGASDAIMTFDSLGRFTTINGAGEAISGYTRDELLGRFFGPLLAVEGLPRAILEFRRALSGVAGQFDSVIVRKDGQRRYITVNYACPQRSQEVLCVIRDATEEKQLQQQLIQSEKMSAIGQLVSGVAHELNNPLASISAFAQIQLRDPDLGDQQRHSAEVIRAEAKRAARIVHNLLTFARQHKAEKTLADLTTVLQDTLELREYELTVRGIAVVRDFDASPCDTMVDVYQMQQVLLNLITNAEQAMQEHERAQHRLVLRTRRNPDTIRIEIQDSGPGVPRESQALIFNPFFTTKPTGQGTGLGLSISLGIISEHNGRIWVDDGPEGGARFSIELPIIAAPRPTPVPEPLPAASPTVGLRVLVADDEEPIRLALEQLLTAAGHSVVAVGTGSEALWRAAGDQEFDAILLDIRMPDISGKQIFQQWRRERPALASRIIFITGDIVSADLQQFLAGTGRPYLAKPFEVDEVLALLPRVRVS